MPDQPESTMTCLNCGSLCDRDEVDIGVGVIHGPWGCSCGWSEDQAYNSLVGGGGWQPDGSYHDTQGGHWPAGNPVVLLMRRMEGEPR